MGDKRRIFLYGRSVILASVGASLQRDGRFEVIHVPRALPGETEFAALSPDGALAGALLFDVTNGYPEVAASLHEASPGLIIVGLSPDGNVVWLWSGHEYRELTTKDLTELIAAGPPPASLPPSSRG